MKKGMNAKISTRIYRNKINWNANKYNAEMMIDGLLLVMTVL